MVAALCAVGLVACSAVGSDGNSAAPTSVAVSSSVGVGPLPPVLSTVALPISTTTSVEPTTTSSTATAAPLVQLGELVTGNRVLMIGDSILASVSKRYGNEVCRTMTPLGWQVEVEAEVSRFVDFGLIVADRMLEQDWDAIVIFLGTNYNRDANQYFKLMNRLINRFGDRPVVVVTVGERNADMVEVNKILRALDETYPNVTIVDWAAATAADPGLLREDLIHLSELGRLSLAMLLAQRFGTAPTGSGKGRCLDQVFVDDSGGIPGFPTTATTVTSTTPIAITTTSTVPRSSTTTNTTTSSTVPRSTTTAPGTTAPGTTAPATTAPGTTAPATTAPATTAPATTAPATTAPATTAASATTTTAPPG
jgi:hypothetical protein